MGMSTSVVGIKPPDAKWKVMKKVWDSCTKAEIDVPYEVITFFDHEPPDSAGVVVELGDAAREYNEEDSQGYEVDLSKLDPDVKIVRFYNSY